MFDVHHPDIKLGPIHLDGCLTKLELLQDRKVKEIVATNKGNRWFIPAIAHLEGGVTHYHLHPLVTAEEWIGPTETFPERRSRIPAGQPVPLDGLEVTEHGDKSRELWVIGKTEDRIIVARQPANIPKPKKPEPAFAAEA